MTINQSIELLDEDRYQAKLGMNDSPTPEQEAAAKAENTRYFTFYLDDHMRYDRYASKSASSATETGSWVAHQEYIPTNFTMQSGTLKPKAYYKLTLHGFAKELMQRGGVWVEEDPIIRTAETDWRDKQMPWGQTREVYFCTGPVNQDLTHSTKLVVPFDDEATTYDALHPAVALANSISDIDELSKPGIEIWADLEREEKGHYLFDDMLYDQNYNRLTGGRSKYQGIKMREVKESGTGDDGNPYEYLTLVPANQNEVAKLTVQKGKTYRWSVYRMEADRLKKVQSEVEAKEKDILDGKTDLMTELASNETLQQWMTDAGGENMIAQWMEQYMNGTDEGSMAFGKEEAVQKVNELIDGAYGRGSTFRKEILSWTFRVSESSATTLSELLSENTGSSSTRTFNKKRIIQNADGRDMTLAGGGLYFQPNGYTLAATADKNNNPYYRLAFWNSDAMFPCQVPEHRHVKHDDAREKGERMSLHFSAKGYRSVSSTIQGNDTSWVKADQYWGAGKRHISGAEFESTFAANGTREWFRYDDGKTTSTVKYIDFMNKIYNEAESAYNDDCNLVELLEKNIMGEFYCLMTGKAGTWTTGYNGSVVNYNTLTKADLDQFDKMSIDTKAIDGNLKSRYRNRSTLGWAIKVNVGDTYIKFPAYQVGLMYFTDRYGNEYRGLPKRSAKKSADSWANPVASTFMAAINNPYVSDLQDYMIENAALNFSADNALKNIKSWKYIVRRPNRYNVKANGAMAYAVANSTKRSNQTLYEVAGKGKTGDTPQYSASSSSFVNGVDIADPALRSYLVGKVGTPLTESKLNTVKEVSISSYDYTVKSWEGIELLTNLESFYTSGLDVDIDFGGNTKLKSITINNAKKLKIDVSQNEALATLKISNTRNDYTAHIPKTFASLAELDLTNNVNLTTLQVNATCLRELDLSNCNKLSSIDLRYNLLTSIDLRGVSDLAGEGKTIYLNKQFASTSDVTLANKADGEMVTVRCDKALRNSLYAKGATYNSYVNPTGTGAHRCVRLVGDDCADESFSNLDVNLAICLYNKFGKAKQGAKHSGKYSQSELAYWRETSTLRLNDLSGITELDCSGYGIKTLGALQEYMPKLQKLVCRGNELRDLDLKSFGSALTSIDVSGNKITKLEFGTVNKNLTELLCASNSLYSLDLRQLTSLKTLDISNNSIKEMDFAPLTKLVSLNVSHNVMTSLFVDKCTSLAELDCSYNNFHLDPSRPLGLLIALPAGKAMTLNLTKATNQTWTKADISKHNVGKLTVRDTALEDLTVNDDYLKSIDFSGSNELLGVKNTKGQMLFDGKLKVEEIVARNTTFGLDITLKVGASAKMVDLSGCNISDVRVNGTKLTGLYVGSPYLTTSHRRQVRFESEAMLTRWDTEWSKDTRNANCYGFYGPRFDTDEAYADEVVAEAGKDVAVSQADMDLKALLGDDLHEHLRSTYTPERTVFPADACERVAELDLVAHHPADLDGTLRYFTKLKRLRVGENYYSTTDYTGKKTENRFATYSPSLTVLTMENPHLLDAPIEIELKGATSIDTLTLHNVNIKAGFVGSYVKKAKSIDLTGCKLNGDDVNVVSSQARPSRLVLDGTNVATVAIRGSGNGLARFSAVDCKQLTNINISGSLQSSFTTDNFRLSPETDVTIDVATASYASKWLKKFAPTYPGMKARFALTFKGGETETFTVGSSTSGNPDRWVAVAESKAKAITKSEYTAIGKNTASDETLLGLFFPDEERRMEVWEQQGKYPDGLHWAEMREWTTLDVSGANIKNKTLFTQRLNQMTKLTTLKARGGIGFETLALPTAKSSITHYDLSGNPELKTITGVSGIPLDASINVSNTGLTTIADLVKSFNTVIASGNKSLTEPLTITTNGKSIDVSGTGISRIVIKLNKTTSLKAANLDSLTLQTAWVPTDEAALDLDGVGKLTVELKTPTNANNWFALFAKKYDAEVRVMVGSSYVPVSSYDEAMRRISSNNALQAAIAKNYPQGISDSRWATITRLDLHGAGLSADVLDDVLDNVLNRAPRLNTLLLHDGGLADDIKQLRLGSDRQWKAIIVSRTGINDIDNLIACSEELLADGLNLKPSSLVVPKDAPLKKLSLLDTYKTIVLEKYVDLTVSPSKVRIHLANEELVKEWFAKSTNTTNIYHNVNGEWYKIASAAEAAQQLADANSTAMDRLKVNYPDAETTDLSAMETIDLSGTQSDNEMLHWVATNMPRVTTIIAEPKGGKDGIDTDEIVVPKMQLPLRTLRLAGNHSATSIVVNATVSASSTADVSNSALWEIDELKEKFATVNASGVTLDDPVVTVAQGDACSSLNLSGSNVLEITIEREMTSLRADDLTADEVQLTTSWLPTSVSNLSLRNAKQLIVKLPTAQMVKTWFDVFGKEYPEAEVRVLHGGSYHTVESHIDAVLLTLAKNYPEGINASQLKSMTSLNLDGVQATADMLDFIWANMPKLNTLSARNGGIAIDQLSLDTDRSSRLKQIDLSGTKAVKAVKVVGNVPSGASIHVDQCDVSSIASLTRKYATVSAQRNASLTGSVTVLSTDAVETLDLSGNNIGSITLGKAIVLTANNMTASTVELTLKAMPRNASQLQISGYRNLVVKLDSYDKVKRWFADFADSYESATVQMQMGSAWMPVANADEAKMWQDFAKKGITADEMATMTTLNLTGQSVTSAMLTPLLANMPKVDEVIMPNKTVKESKLTLAATRTPLKRLDVSNTPGLTEVLTEGLADESYSEINVSQTGIADLTASGIVRKFTTIKADDCDKLTGDIVVARTDKAKSISVVGSKVRNFRLGKAVALDATGLKGGNVVVEFTDELPTNSDALRITGYDNLTVKLPADIAVVRRWFEHFDHKYSMAVVQIELNGEWTQVLTATDAEKKINAAKKR